MRRYYFSAFGCAVLFIAPPPPARAQSAPLPLSPEFIKFVTPADNPTTEAKAKLGDKLFEDKRLSVDNTVACNTCHDPRTDSRSGSKPPRDSRSVRQTQRPHHAEHAVLPHPVLGWPRAVLEEQAKMPI